MMLLYHNTHHGLGVFKDHNAWDTDCCCSGYFIHSLLLEQWHLLGGGLTIPQLSHDTLSRSCDIIHMRNYINRMCWLRRCRLELVGGMGIITYVWLVATEIMWSHMCVTLVHWSASLHGAVLVPVPQHAPGSSLWHIYLSIPMAFRSLPHSTGLGQHHPGKSTNAQRKGGTFPYMRITCESKTAAQALEVQPRPMKELLAKIQGCCCTDKDNQ